MVLSACKRMTRDPDLEPALRIGCRPQFSGQGAVRASCAETRRGKARSRHREPSGANWSFETLASDITSPATLAQ